MPFTDADGSPITCHTCPFKVGVDCTAMPPLRSTNQMGMPNWDYPPARNPCVRHPAINGENLSVTQWPGGVTAVLWRDMQEKIPITSAEVIATEDVEAGDPVYITPGTIEAEPTERINPDDVIPPVEEPAKPPTRSRASRATARPAE